MDDKTKGNGVDDSEFAYIFKFRKTYTNFNDLWAMKSSARESLRDWMIAWVCDPKTAENSANACSELIENCIKFSLVDTVSTVRIRIREKSIVVETANRSNALNRETIREMIDKVRDMEDLRGYFARTLLTRTPGKSQLGIIKIIMETQGVISFSQGPEEGDVRVRLEIDAFLQP
jgi:anti-sigma regulatory factor (Ser/Thr protein kinase)